MVSVAQLARSEMGFQNRRRGPLGDPFDNLLETLPGKAGKAYFSPARTGRQRQWPQVKPPCPQLGAGPPAPPEPALEPVRTLTEVKLRSTSDEPHWGHSGLLPSEYSDMDIRTSNGKLQYWHL